MLGGVVLAVDMRLLGLGLKTLTPAELSRKLQPWLIGSLIVIIGTGIPMFLSEAIKCYFSPPFFYKMGLLLIATVFTFTVRRRVAGAQSSLISSTKARLTAAVSLALWFGVGFAGRWIAFY